MDAVQLKALHINVIGCLPSTCSAAAYLAYLMRTHALHSAPSLDALADVLAVDPYENVRLVIGSLDGEPPIDYWLDFRNEHVITCNATDWFIWSKEAFAVFDPVPHRILEPEPDLPFAAAA